MKKVLFSILLLCLSSSVFAQFRQTVTLCIYAPIVYSYVTFIGSFTSTDIFDSVKTFRVERGSQCITHTYNYGPKNITLDIKTDLGGEITPDESCLFMQQLEPAHFHFDKFRTSNHNERWEFHFTKNPNALKKFEMSCEYLAWGK